MVRKEIAAYKQYRRLCENLADVMEQLSLEPPAQKEDSLKKNSMKPGS
jgi:hypothetical protein